MRNVFENCDEDEKIKKSLLLGQEYLDGNWNLLTKEDIEIKRILGGQSNLLYLVSTTSERLRDNETRKFLVRIHRQPLTSFQMSQDVLIFNVLAERGLGPKIYGFFEGGRLEEYLESRTLTEGDYVCPKLAEKIGATFRKFHTLQMPISKKPQAILKMRKWLEETKKLGGKSHEINQFHVNYENIPKVVTIEDLEHELCIIEKMCTVFDDTVVFCHNDLAAMNILELKESKNLLFIDFEYSMYNWRGFDLGMHLSEYAFDYRTTIPPCYKLDSSFYENNPNIRLLCSSYLNSDNCDDLMDECRFFWPVCNMFYAIWAFRIYMANDLDNGIDLRANCSDRLALYFHLKKRSIEIYEKRRKL